MSRYKLMKNGVFDQENNMFIPNDPANRHWQEYQEWLRQGNVPDLEYTLDELKDRLKGEAKAVRKQKEADGIVVVGTDGTMFQFDTSLTGRANLQAVINSFQMGFLNPEADTVHWKFMDGRFYDLTYEQLKELAGFALHYVEALFKAESLHREAIEQLTSLEEAEQYDVNANWPSNEYRSSLLP